MRTAWGRDYADLTPLKGVILGGGAHTLEVSVDMVRAYGARTPRPRAHVRPSRPRLCRAG